MFVAGMTIFGCNVLKWIWMNNEGCKIRQKTVNINSNEPIFYSYSIEINKCSYSCNISDRYAKINMGVPDALKNIILKIFNIMSRTDKKRHIERHETCKCNVDANVRNYVIKEYLIKDLFRILALVNVTVIIHVMLENI